MTIASFLLFLLVAAVCGAIGQSIVGYSHGGCLATIAVGLIGGLLGTWIAGMLGMRELLAVNVGGETVPIVWSIIGSALFVAVLSFLSGRRRLV